MLLTVTPLQPTKLGFKEKRGNKKYKDPFILPMTKSEIRLVIFISTRNVLARLNGKVFLSDLMYTGFLLQQVSGHN